MDIYLRLSGILFPRQPGCPQRSAAASPGARAKRFLREIYNGLANGAWRDHLKDESAQCTAILQNIAAGDCSADRVKNFIESNNLGIDQRLQGGYTLTHFLLKKAWPNSAAPIQILLHHGVNYETVAENGDSLMHDAVRFASPAIFDTLVQLGSTQLNAMNPQGETPLHCAVQQGDGLMVGLLLANQADPLQASDTGRSALDLALQKVTNEYPAITTGTAKIAEKMIVAARQKNSVMDLDLLTIRFLGALVLKPAAFAYDGNDPRHLRQILLALGEKRTPGLLTGHEIFLHELNVQLRQAAACGGSESKSEARENIRFCQVYAAEIVNGALLQGQQQRAHGLGLAQR